MYRIDGRLTGTARRVGGVGRVVFCTVTIPVCAPTSMGPQQFGGITVRAEVWRTGARRPFLRTPQL